MTVYTAATATIAATFVFFACLSLLTNGSDLVLRPLRMVILLMSFAILTVVALGRELPPWVGLLVMVTSSVAAAYYLGFSDTMQHAIMGLQLLPLMAFYFAWLYGPRLARIAELGVLGAVTTAALLGPSGATHGLGPINVAGLNVSTWVLLEVGIALRRHVHAEVVTDALTGALSRRGFELHAQAVLSQAVRSGRPVSLALIDVDDMKCLNDTQGHLAGDDVLRRLVAQWMELSRAQDVFGRVGGDEFMVVLPDTDLEQGAVLLRRARGQAVHPWSYGLVEVAPGESLTDATVRADVEMYVHKRARGAPGRLAPTYGSVPDAEGPDGHPTRATLEVERPLEP